MARANPSGVLVVAAGLGLLGGGCKQDRIDVIESPEDRTGDYGREALTAAVETFRKDPASPAAYRVLAVTIESIRPAFNQAVADQAERYLAFLALKPLAASAGDSPAEAMAELALTVWPTALHIEPKPGETSRGFFERACQGPLAAECKYVVPEAWPTVFSALVWRRMKARAREAYSDCRPCHQDRSYDPLLEKYDQYDSAAQRRLHQTAELTERSAWPESGETAAAWSGSAVLDLVAEPPMFAGHPVEGDWKHRIRDRRGARSLGLHVGPRTEVRHVRAVLRVAAGAGYHTIALQARRRDYPYDLTEYRIAVRRRGRLAVELRDTDTVQVLVRALDTALDRAGTGASGPVSLRR